MTHSMQSERFAPIESRYRTAIGYGGGGDAAVDANQR
jgi:hypothetical protein